jgi:hypothetical protein
MQFGTNAQTSTMTVLTVQAKQDASINDIKQQALRIVIKRKVDSSKRKDLVKPPSLTGVADSRAAADLSKKKTQSTTLKNFSTKKDINKLAEQLVLKKLREKSDRSIQSESSKARSARRLTSSDDTAGTACSSSLSSQSTMDDESFHSQLLDVSSASTSFHTAEPQDDVFFDSAVNEVAVLPSSVSMDEVLQNLLSKELRSREERNERLVIMGSREHRDFYLSFTRQLYCMIASCEVLSSDMVMSGNSNRNGANVLRYLGTRLLQTESLVELARRTKPGKLLATAANFAKKNLSVIPFSDALGSIVAVVATLKSERDRVISIQQVADFATAVSVAASTTGTSSSENGVRMTAEHIARTLVRARCFMPRRAFVEERSEFGRIKQLMLHVLGETSTNTPAKEQAYMAASCVLAHIMAPQGSGGVLYDFAEIARGSVDIHEVLVAATLNSSVEEIQRLPQFSCATLTQCSGIEA